MLNLLEAFHTVLDSLPVATFIKDSEHRFVLANKLACHYFGLPEQEILGRTDHDFFPASQAAGFQKIDALVLQSGEPHEQEEEITDGHGVTHIVITRKTLLTTGERRYVVGSIQDVTQLRESQARTRYLAYHDTLTGLPNRTTLYERLNQELRAPSSRKPVALMLIDLDSFKNVNDVHGHQAGDELLREFGRRLKHLVFDEDLVARMGGDEFAIFLSSPQSVTHVEELSSRIIDAATAPFKIMGTESYVGASIGVFLPGDADMQPGEAMRRADTALYEAKRAGKARYSVYSMEMDASVAYRRKIERELSLALAGAGGLSCHYQPLVRSCDGAITGVEVLARWHHAEMGAIAPGQFIPVAEESGLIRQLGEWILRRACQELRQWHQLQVAVNISPIQVREPNFSEKILSLLEEEGFPPHRLELEITESAIASVDEAWIGQIKRLREKGMRIALDDFGTGYSSLRLLRDFDLDKVKIDRSFVQFVTEESESAAIVEALARIGKTLQLEVVAEGVETAEQRLFLVEAGCTALQGFLLGRPLDAASLESFLQASCPSTEHIKGAGC